MTGTALRPLSTGEILDVAFSLYRRQFVTLATLALVTQGAALLLSIYLSAAGGMTENIGLFLASTALSSVCAAIGMGASTKIIADLYLSRQTAAGEALRWVVPHIGKIIVLTIIMWTLIMFGFIALVIPGIVLACGWAVSSPALVVEGLSPTDALSRAWNLSKGHRWRVLGTLVVSVILIYVASVAAVMIGGLIALVASGGSIGAVLIIAGLSALLSVVTYPFVYAAIVVLYYDLRVRKEGFDLELLEAQLTAS